MKVKVNISGIDMSCDVGPIIKSFYSGCEVDIEYLGDEAEDEESEGCRILELSLKPDSFSIFLDKELKISEGFVYIDEPDDRLSFEKRRHRAYKNQLLRALYRVLSEDTGRELPWGILTGVRPTKLLFERLKDKTVGNISYMVKEYYCSPKKAGLAQRTAARELELLEKIDYSGGYSLYIGIPFCPSICNYCSFGSHPLDRFGHLADSYILALLKEIEQCSDILRDKRLQTIYFGGGTPTAITAGQLKSVIDKVKQCFDLSNVLEFTVEAGRPDSIDEEKLAMLKDEGVNRISINPQTMSQRTLDLIGRRHTVEQTVNAFHMARKAGFENINMDLIAGLSGEIFSDMEHTLEEVKKLDPDCITVHTLALKRAARLVTDREKYRDMEAADVGRMVEYAADFCMQNGYEPYYLYRQKNMAESLENVGYAKPGKEGLYNILIMEEVQMILALGAGASSKFVYRNAQNGRRFGRIENVKNVGEYILRIDEMIERKRSIYNV